MKKLLFPLLMLLISFGLIIGCSGGGGGGSTGSDNSNLTVSTMEIKGKFNVSSSAAAKNDHAPSAGNSEPSRIALPKNPYAILNDFKTKKVVGRCPIDAYGNFVFYGDFRDITLSISIASTDTEIIIGNVPSNMPLNSRILVSYPYDNTGGFDEYAIITSNIIKCKNLVDSIKIDRYNGAQNLWDMVTALKPEIQAYIAANPSKTLSTLITETVSASSPATMAITSKINLPAGSFDHFYMTTDSPQIAGSPITLTIYAKDANESTVTNYAGTGTLIVSNPAGTISWTGNGLSNAGNGAASYSSITFSKGVASIRLTSSSTDVSKTFTITDSSTGKYASTTLTWNVNTSQVFDHFTVTSNNPQSMNSFITLTITAKNSAEGIVNTYSGSGTVAISSPVGTITWAGTGVTAGTNGSANFSNATFVNGVATIQVRSTAVESARTFTITDSASGKASTSSLSWINDVLDHFSISTISSPQSAGVPFLITITALNSSNETITNYSSTASLSDTTSTISPNATGAFSNGVWSGNVTIASVRSNITIIASSNSKVGASNPITLTRALSSISLSKASDVALVSSSYDLSKIKVTAQYSDSTSSDVAASWSIQAGGGTISGINYNTPSSAVVALLTASYTDGGVTKTATLVLDVLSSLKVASPVFTPTSGTTFTTSQSVTISCATSGATIKYTIDGSTPSASNGITYSTPITLSSTTTIKAVAYKSGLTDSDVVTATYTKSGTTPGETKIVDIGGGVTLEMVKINSAGHSFQMGSPDTEKDRRADEGPVHAVSFTKDYYIGKYEVTQGQWMAIMNGANPSRFKTGGNYPVDNISWNGICGTNGFLEKLNALKPSGYSGFRLPTEAEWEYAARGGTQTKFHWGDDPSYTLVNDYAWYYINSSSSSQVVGKKLSNQFGLYDMAGNVYEWCNDWYGSYGSGAVIDPLGPATGSDRVYRGGGWGGCDAAHCSPATRYSLDPPSLGDIIGFRLAMSASQIPYYETIEKPTFSPVSGTTFTTSQLVTISCATSGATIKYTIDGSTPSTSNGITYTQAILITDSATIRTIAYKSGMNDSEIVTAVFNIEPSQITFSLGNGVSLEMIRIPAGTFQMGSPETEPSRYLNETLHTVTISKSFYIGKYEVTQGQWKSIINSNNPSIFNTGDDYPVDNATWNDITNNFLPALNAKNLGQGTFRLPTEAQWEYACRAGTTTAYYWGTTMNGNYCWYGNNSNSTTHPAGQKLPNAWGLFDMSGNVSEWCSDLYGTYPSGTTVDPTGATTGTSMNMRGGSFHSAVYKLGKPVDSEVICRSADRGYREPDTGNSGFRLVFSKN